MANKKMVTIGLVVAAVIAVVGVKMYSGLSRKDTASIDARSKGDAQAKVQIIEFIDFECPACAAGSKLLKEYAGQHPQDIRLQIKYFPLVRPHPHAMQVALYSECAGRQGKFWEFHELLMPQQQQWSTLINAEPAFQQMAKDVGLDAARLSACVSSPEALKSIDDDKTLGQSLGIQSTPTYFINNKMVVGTKALKDELESYFPPR